MTFRIGIVGIASIATKSFIPAIQKSDHFLLSGIASRDFIKCSSVAEILEVKPFESYDDLISSSSIDAVYIPLPTGLHFKWIKKAILAKKHVYSEKSFASNYQQCEELVDLAKQNDVALFEGYMFLYHEVQRTVKKLVDEGNVGQIRYFSGYFGFPPLDQSNFRYDEVLGGGVILDAAGYPLRAASYFLGDALEINSAHIHRDPVNNTSLWGSAFFLDRSNNHISGSVAFGFDNSYQCNYTIWGSKASIYVPKAYTNRPSHESSIIIRTSSEEKVIKVMPDDHFVNALDAFMLTIKNINNRNKSYRDILIQAKLLTHLASF